MADIADRLRVACAALLMVAATAACETRAQFAPSLPPAAGFRVDGDVLKLWTGTPCSGVTGLTLIFDSGTKQSQDQVWKAPLPGVPLERMDLLSTTPGKILPDGGGSLPIREPLPATYDWTRAGSVVLSLDGPTAWGARVDVAQVLRESAQHPPDSYLFGKQGWMNATDVRRENLKSFLTICSEDPN